MDVGLIGGIILIAILTVSVFVALKKLKDGKDAEKFINGLADKIFEITLETIGDVKSEEFTDFDTFSNLLINNVYVAVWDYVKYTAEEAAEVNQITKNVFKLIDKETIVEFVDKMFEDEKLYDKIYNDFASPKIQTLLENQEEEEVYDSEEYYTEEVVNPEDLNPAGEKVYTEEELEEIANLKPPVDEESEFVDLEDDSIEILVDKKEIVAQTSKNGQVRYYELDSNGKKTRVTKEYAMTHMEG